MSLKRIAGLLVLCASCNGLSLFAAPAVRPNIVVVLVDDMGFADLGCYGSEIPTPNLDALAADGLKFTQFYNTGRCCPTRASLLTGLYPHQAGVGHMMTNDKAPGYQGHLNDRCVTIAEVLKAAGYFTAISGKWHVGYEQGTTPVGRGFDRSLIAPAGGFYYTDALRARLVLNGEELKNDDPRLPKHGYTTDLWPQFGLAFIDEALAAKKPFYLHLCFNAPHFPLQAPAEEIERFRGTYKEGWGAVGLARYERQQKMGLLDAAWAKSPRPEEVALWKDVSDDQRDRFDHIMATYAAVVHHMDKAVGDLVAGLKRRGVYDNTLILFMSDNGGNAESGPQGKTVGDPSRADSNWFCGMSWAFVENTPFRLFKHFNHEGGVATPMIAHWPAGIAAKGEWRTQPAHLIDVMPTCVELAGAAYPTEFNGKPILPMEGRSLVPAFANRPIAREALYWEHEGNAAVRAGDFKLVRRGRNGAWELYDMKADRTELHDLAASQPEKAKALAAMWEAWAARAQVKPYPEKEQMEKAAKGARRAARKRAAPAGD